MRELAVFYCPKCGHYAYYQTSRHPQCPKCGCEEAMYMVRMHYTEFMRMSCDERDEFLSKEILKTNPSLVERLTAPAQALQQPRDHCGNEQRHHEPGHGKQNPERHGKMDA